MNYPESEVNPELLAMCPKMGERGKLVVWRGKRYFIARHPNRDMVVWVKRIKGARSYDNAR